MGGRGGRGQGGTRGCLPVSWRCWALSRRHAVRLTEAVFCAIASDMSAVSDNGNMSGLIHSSTQSPVRTIANLARGLPSKTLINHPARKPKSKNDSRSGMTNEWRCRSAATILNPVCSSREILSSCDSTRHDLSISRSMRKTLPGKALGPSSRPRNYSLVAVTIETCPPGRSSRYCDRRMIQGSTWEKRK